MKSPRFFTLAASLTLAVGPRAQNVPNVPMRDVMADTFSVVPTANADAMLLWNLVPQRN